MEPSAHEASSASQDAADWPTPAEPSDADVGAGATLGRWVALLIMVVLISLAFCCLG